MRKLQQPLEILLTAPCSRTVAVKFVDSGDQEAKIMHANETKRVDCTGIGGKERRKRTRVFFFRFGVGGGVLHWGKKKRIIA